MFSWVPMNPRIIATLGAALIGLAPPARLRAAAPAPAPEPPLAAQDMPHIPPTAPDRALGTFQIKPGFRMELVAAEPLVMDPVAIDFDENGRMFVVEMRDYSERRDEHLGRIRFLEDTDGDGRFDKSTIFAEDLAWPTAVICSDGGVFVGATPDILYLKDTNGDGRADVREVVWSGFGVGVDRLNVQRLLNSFHWGLDSRIHGANGGNGGLITSPKKPGSKPLDLRSRDFSFDPRTLDFRAETGGGQHGMCYDNRGRRFVCSNSAHIQILMYDDPESAGNPASALPNPLLNIAVDGPAAEVYRVSPEEPWRVIRTKWRIAGLVPGPIEGGGRASGYFTSATGITIYRGNAWPADYLGDAFIADCGSNLIHRKKVLPDGAAVLAKRADDEQKSEFVASTDIWFRPVQFANAPDGTLYVVDMYREIIEHPWSLPQNIKHLIDLNSGNDRGRIYRIVPDRFRQPALPRLGAATTAELVQTLEHPNGWHRETAARLLWERRDPAAAPLLGDLLERSRSELGRLHALHALKGLESLRPDQVARGLSDSAAGVRMNAVRLSPGLLARASSPSALLVPLLRLASDPDPTVRYQLALTVGGVPMPRETKAATLAELIAQDMGDPWIRAAVLSSLGEAVDFSFFQAVARNTDPTRLSRLDGPQRATREFLGELVRLIAAQKRQKDIGAIVAYLSALDQPAPRFVLGRALKDGLRRASMDLRDMNDAIQRQWRTVEQEALTAAVRDQDPVEHRVPAIHLVAALPWSQAGGPLSALLTMQQPPPVQAAAVAGLVQYREPEAAQALVRHWPQFTPRLRSEAMNALLSRPAHTLILLGGIENGLVQRTELSSLQTESLRSHRDRGIRGRAAQLLPAAGSADRAQILKQLSAALEMTGQAARGKKIYTERCISCHRHGTEGYAVGPDFTSVKSGGKEKLLTSIVDPNREVAPGYLNYSIETKEGESLMGIITHDSGASVTLRRAFGDESVVPRSQIQRIQSSSLSLMPEGLEVSLSPQDLADLLDFIISATPTP